MSEQSVNGTEQEYISREETESQTQDSSKSYREQMENIQNSDFGDNDEKIESISRSYMGEYNDEKGYKVNSASMRQRYDEIIKQNNELSNEVAENIKLMDINEESADLVANTIREIEAACSRKSIGERMTNALPAPIRNFTNKMRKDTEVGMHKQRSVTELATRHFDALNDKKKNLTDNLEHIYVIRDKLEQSTEELGKMEQVLIGHIDEVDQQTQQAGNAAEARIEKLKSKEMTVQVQTQIITQRDLINQVDAVQYVAEQVVDSINNTLPSIKSNFIDQVSITAGLKNMKDLKESIDKTRNMTITLQEQTFSDMQQIMTEIHQSGVGYTKEEMDRIEKLQQRRREFNKNMNSNFTQNDKNKDAQIKRLSKMMSDQTSFLEMSESHQIEEEAKRNKNSSRTDDKGPE